MTTIDELDSKISEMSQTLTQSQCASNHPTQYPNYKRLTPNEHFDLWNEMWKLIQARDAMAKANSAGS